MLAQKSQYLSICSCVSGEKLEIINVIAKAQQGQQSLGALPAILTAICTHAMCGSSRITKVCGENLFYKVQESVIDNFESTNSRSTHSNNVSHALFAQIVHPLNCLFS